MKILIIITFSLFTSIVLFGQDVKMYAFSEGEKPNRKWGFKDNTGKIIIPVKYDQVGWLNAPISAVSLNGKWGFIDRNDRQIVPIKYESVNSRYFTDKDKPYFAVSLSNKWGFVDNANKILVPIKYEEAEGFFEDLCKVKQNGKYGFINWDDQVVIPFKYDGLSSFVNGTASAYLNSKEGVIDKMGKELIPIKYNSIEIFIDGIARVQIDGKYGFIDKKGNEILPVQYSNVEFFNNGRARVEKDGKFFMIDKTGTAITTATQIVECGCVDPNDFAKLCSYSKDKKRSNLDEYTFLFEETLLKMACVDLKKDSKETIIRKVNCMWNQYRSQIKCDQLGFGLPNGNIAKFVINFNFPDWYYLLKDNYNLDFDYADPADGKTLAQWLDQEIAKTYLYGSGKIKEMQEIRDDLKKTYKYNPADQTFEIVK